MADPGRDFLNPAWTDSLFSPIYSQRLGDYSWAGDSWHSFANASQI